ncbi:unnamed protein product [Schistocephalus solidus]|uniref:ATP-dependent DNA ligase n=1 Tax=Schistocephalus solidus TaxID=70667 RepID=A0A183SVE8_SCHSO|nr:unnamed protein product [Schistocephalus solidus]
MNYRWVILVSRDDTVNLDPLDDDEQKPPASFREMMWLKQNIESKHPFRLDPDTVKFGEVVKAPPVLKTMPKKVGGKGACESGPEPLPLDKWV